MIGIRFQMNSTKTLAKKNNNLTSIASTNQPDCSLAPVVVDGMELVMSGMAHLKLLNQLRPDGASLNA